MTVAVIAVGLGGCSGTVVGLERLELQTFEPPAEYHAWWQTLTTHFTPHHSFESLQFDKVLGPLNSDGHFPCVGQQTGRICSAQTIDKRQILISGAHLDNGHLIRHEMCHIITNQGHGQARFKACDAWDEPPNRHGFPPAY